MLLARLVLAAALLTSTTACGSHAVADKSAAAMAAETACQSHFDRRFHLHPGPKTVDEGFAKDLGHGRLRLDGVVPVQRGLTHRESYICVVRQEPSGLRIVRFEVRPAA